MRMHDAGNLVNSFLRRTCTARATTRHPKQHPVLSAETMRFIQLYREAKADPARQARFAAMEAERKARLDACQPRYEEMMGCYPLTVKTHTRIKRSTKRMPTKKRPSHR